MWRPDPRKARHSSPASPMERHVVWQPAVQNTRHSFPSAPTAALKVLWEAPSPRQPDSPSFELEQSIRLGSKSEDQQIMDQRIAELELQRSSQEDTEDVDLSSAVPSAVHSDSPQAADDTTHLCSDWQEDRETNSESVLEELVSLQLEASNLREIHEFDRLQHQKTFEELVCELKQLRDTMLTSEGPDTAASGGSSTAATAADLQPVESEHAAERSVLMRALEVSEARRETCRAEADELRNLLASCEQVANAATQSAQEAISECQAEQEIAASKAAYSEQSMEELRIALYDALASKKHLLENQILAHARRDEAESGLREYRWIHFATLLLRREYSKEMRLVRDAWWLGVEGWRNFAGSLIEKLNNGPTSQLAQQMDQHCVRGDRRLMALEQNTIAQGEQMAEAVRQALAEFQQAQDLWELRLRREAARRNAAEAKAEAAVAAAAAERPQGIVDEPIAEQLRAQLREERAEVLSLQQRLAEAERTIGALVIQSSAAFVPPVLG